jgi:hypothetical protein
MNTVDLSAARWRKSSHSGGESGDCVEVAGLPGMVAVRDSKDPDGAKLIFTPGDWRTFTRGVKGDVPHLA